MIQPSAGGSALGTAPAAESYRVLRTLALVAVSLGVVVLAAAAFVLSYHGIRAVALEAGVSPDLARLYPPMFDVMLVIAGAAVLFLRGAEWIVRAFAWLSLLVLLAAAAGASTLYATHTHLPHKTAATIAAILPWALALLGFFLLLVMLRHARLRRAQSRRATSAAAVAQQADTIPGTVPSVLGAVPAAAAAAEHPAFGADDNWPDGEYPDGAAGSDGQTTEPAATGYPGDILVAGRPPADDPDADAAATDEQPAAGEPAAHGTAAGAAVAGAAVAGAAVAGAAAGEAAADDPADHRSAPTVAAQALPAQTEPASTEPMSTGSAGTEPAGTEPAGTEPAGTEPAGTEPADTEPADTAPASTSAEAAGTTAGIPLRWPGQSSADQPEADEPSLDSEPGQDDPVSDEAHPASRPGVVWVPRAREEPSDEVIKDEPEPSPADPAEGTTGSQEASTGAPEPADEGTAPAGPAGAATEPGQAEGSWSTPANGSAEPAGAALEQPGGAPGPAEQPAQPPVTSFWDSVFGPRTQEGTGQPASTAPAGTNQEQAEGHPATQPSETATADEEPQFDRFRSSPTPPDDE
jgi:Protein of unknown function (DUF2637)